MEDVSHRPPYIGWSPFWTFIEELRAQGSAPQIVDNTVIGDNRSGAARSQLLIALRFLGLVDENRNKTDQLDTLVQAEDPKAVVGDMLRSHFGALFDLNLMTATTAQVEKALTEMGAGTGETLHRTRGFFTKAAQFAGIPLGPYLAKTSTATGGNGRKPKRTRRGTPAVRVNPPALRPPGDEYSVDLPGGRVTVTIAVNLWELPKEDRDFVLDLIDSIKGHGTAMSDPSTVVNEGQST